MPAAFLGRCDGATSSTLTRLAMSSAATGKPSRSAITYTAPANARSPWVESLAPLSMALYSAMSDTLASSASVSASRAVPANGPARSMIFCRQPDGPVESHGVLACPKSCTRSRFAAVMDDAANWTIAPGKKPSGCSECDVFAFSSLMRAAMNIRSLSSIVWSSRSAASRSAAIPPSSSARSRVRLQASDESGGFTSTPILNRTTGASPLVTSLRCRRVLTARFPMVR